MRRAGKCKKIKFGLAVLLLLALLMTPACWDKKEVERLGFVTAVGVENAPEGKVRIIVQQINPAAQMKGAGGGGGRQAGTASKPYTNQSAEGETLFKAIRELSQQSSRRIFFAHSQLIIISEDLARQRGVKEVLDFFERNPEIRLTNWLLVGRGDLSALLDVPPRREATPAQRVASIIEERNLTSQYAMVNLGDFLELMESECNQPYAAVVELAPNEATRDKTTAEHMPEPDVIIKLNGTAVFRRDKMVGWLDSRESRGLLWVRGKVKGGVIHVPGTGGENRPVSLEIVRSKTELRPEIVDGEITMTVAIEVESNLGETMENLDLTRPAIIDELEKQAAAAVMGEIESALFKAQQEYGVDVFGFGDAVLHKYPQDWREMKGRWTELFPNVQVQLQVAAKISRTGLVNKPVEPKQQ